MGTPSVQSQVSAEEWKLRVDLAACYRLVALYGWSDLVFTHISARIPGPEHHFLINPYGLMFDEITASSLVKVDQQCNKLIESPYPVNPAGFVIHSAVHEVREDAGCVLHTHTRAGVAVSAQKAGILPLSQQSTFVLASLAYHDYEGVAFRAGRKAAPAGRPGPCQLLGAAQPRPANRGQNHCRRILVHVHVRGHLPNPDRRTSRRRAHPRQPRHCARRDPRPCAYKPAAWVAPLSGPP